MSYKLQRVGDGDGAALFESEDAAEKIRDIFNERYKSEYEVVEYDGEKTASMVSGDILKNLEKVQ